MFFWISWSHQYLFFFWFFVYCCMILLSIDYLSKNLCVFREFCILCCPLENVKTNRFWIFKWIMRNKKKSNKNKNRIIDRIARYCVGFYSQKLHKSCLFKNWNEHRIWAHKKKRRKNGRMNKTNYSERRKGILSFHSSPNRRTQTHTEHNTRITIERVIDMTPPILFHSKFFRFLFFWIEWEIDFLKKIVVFFFIPFHSCSNFCLSTLFCFLLPKQKSFLNTCFCRS